MLVHSKRELRLQLELSLLVTWGWGGDRSLDYPGGLYRIMWVLVSASGEAAQEGFVWEHSLAFAGLKMGRDRPLRKPGEGVKGKKTFFSGALKEHSPAHTFILPYWDPLLT